MLNQNQSSKRQVGFTLIEALIGIALSMIVVTSMVGLMGNSMSSATRIIQMTQLSDELRNTMSMLTRDIRRANYNAAAIQCYANASCGLDGGIVTINGDPAGDCMIFNLDRDQTFGTNDGAGGFRLQDSGGVGYIEMWVGGGDTTPTCNDLPGAGSPVDNWIALTDPNIVDIRNFTVDTSGSLLGSLPEDEATTINQETRQIKVVIEGELLVDRRIKRMVEDTIKVRNDRIWRTGS